MQNRNKGNCCNYYFSSPTGNPGRISIVITSLSPRFQLIFRKQSLMYADKHQEFDGFIVINDSLFSDLKSPQKEATEHMDHANI